MVAAGAFSSIFMFIFLAIAPEKELPQDLLSLLGPSDGLSILGEETSEENIKRLIRVDAPEAPATGGGKLSKELESAIQNLASSSVKIRENARKKLVAGGAAVVARMKEVEKNDARRAAEAKKVLETISDTAASKAADRGLAQCFAIRYAAEKKMESLLPDIRAAAKSKDYFVRLAAEDAILRITGQPASPNKTVAPEAPISLRAVRALPLNAKMPGPGKAGTFTISAMFDSIFQSFPGGAPPEMEEEKKRAMVAYLNFVRSYGNMRLDRLVVANVGMVGPTGGGLGIVLHGTYQGSVLRSTLKNDAQWKTTEVSKTTVYNSPFLRVVILDDRSVLLLPVMASNFFPLQKYLANFEAEKDAISENARLKQFISTLEKPFQVRALALTDENLMKEVLTEFGAGELGDALKGMKEVEFSLAKTEKGHQARVEGLFDKTDNAKVISTLISNSAKEALTEIEGLLQNVQHPVLKSMADMLKSVKTSAEAKRGILRADLPQFRIMDFYSGIMGVGVTGGG